MIRISIGGSVVTSAFPGDIPFNLKVSGVMQAVFAYGGAMIFVEMMNEMKRPYDFWKGAISAQLFIFCVYLFYGVFVYHFQGQFTIITANLGISVYSLQTVTNVFGIITGMIAAALYGNIGVKVIYTNVLQTYFGAPEMATRGGRITWIFSVLAYWAFAFVFASAIPSLSSMSTLVAAACIFQFTYTFPPIIWLSYTMQKDAMIGDEPWTPGKNINQTRVDSWRSASRWKRGFAPLWYVKSFLIVIFLAALATAGLGMYSGILGIKATFAIPGSHATSFGCASPV